MATIALVSGDKRLRIGNDEILWQFGFGTNWQQIRVGMLYLVNMSATIASPLFQVGVNAGTAFGFRSNSCIEYMGAKFTNGSLSGFTYTATAPTYFTGAAYSMHYKVGSTDTITSSNAANYAGSANPAIRTYIYFDFIKRTANGQMSVSIAGAAAPPTSTDITSDLFYRYMEYDYLPWSPLSFGTNLVAVAYNGPYSFDSLSLIWGDNTNTLEISELMVNRYA